MQKLLSRGHELCTVACYNGVCAAATLIGLVVTLHLFLRMVLDLNRDPGVDARKRRQQMVEYLLCRRTELVPTHTDLHPGAPVARRALSAVVAFVARGGMEQDGIAVVRQVHNHA